MQIFTDKDFPDADVKLQILQIIFNGQNYSKYSLSGRRHP